MHYATVAVRAVVVGPARSPRGQHLRLESPGLGVLQAARPSETHLRVELIHEAFRRTPTLARGLLRAPTFIFSPALIAHPAVSENEEEQKKSAIGAFARTVKNFSLDTLHSSYERGRHLLWKKGSVVSTAA